MAFEATHWVSMEVREVGPVDESMPADMEVVARLLETHRDLEAEAVALEPPLDRRACQGHPEVANMIDSGGHAFGYIVM